MLKPEVEDQILLDRPMQIKIGREQDQEVVETPRRRWAEDIAKET